jgi:hypothetical protein
MNKDLKYIKVQNTHKVANFVLCDIALVLFLEYDPLWIEPYRNTECDVVI